MPTFPQSDVDPAEHNIARFAHAALQSISMRARHRFVLGTSIAAGTSVVVGTSPGTVPASGNPPQVVTQALKPEHVEFC